MSTSSETRVELAMDEGEVIQLDCPQCQMINDLPVDEFSARTSKTARTIALLILAVGTPLSIWFFLFYFAAKYDMMIIGGVVLAPLLIYGMLKKQEERRVHAFNAHKLKAA